MLYAVDRVPKISDAASVNFVELNRKEQKIITKEEKKRLVLHRVAAFRRIRAPYFGRSKAFATFTLS